MRTTEILKKMKSGRTVDEYLGYAIHEAAGRYLAIPRGWTGEVLEASNMPQIRRKIWRWWFQLSV